MQQAEDETAQRITLENDLIKGALLGYAQMDVLKTNLVFGEWNVRTVNQTEVKKIAEGMRSEGIHQYEQDHFLL